MRQEVDVGTVEDEDDEDDSVDHVPANMADHFAGAYEKGALAYRDGKDDTACPYPDRRNSSAFGTSWSRVWRKAWFLGYDNERRVQNGEQPKDYRKGPWR